MSEWISKVCKEYEINESEVELLKNQNGKGLDDLPEKLWIRRSPNHGDTLFLQWQKLKEYWALKSDEEDENENAGIHPSIGSSVRLPVRSSIRPSIEV